MTFPAILSQRVCWLLLIVALLAACGDSDGVTEAPPTRESTAATPTARAASLTLDVEQVEAALADILSRGNPDAWNALSCEAQQLTLEQAFQLDLSSSGEMIDVQCRQDTRDRPQIRCQVFGDGELLDTRLLDSSGEQLCESLY